MQRDGEEEQGNGNVGKLRTKLKSEKGWKNRRERAAKRGGEKFTFYIICFYTVEFLPQ